MDVYVARQPIFDRHRQVYAYELLFRSGPTNAFGQADADEASMRVIADSFLRFGIEKMTGGRPAFINFTRDTLVKGYATLLPKETIVVEVLETVEPDDEVIDACRELKRLGYTLALDDFICDDWSNPLVRFADIIKVDFRATTGALRESLPRDLATMKLRSLAEKVETRDEFDQAIQMGYTYLQGYFFSKPLVLSGRDIPGVRMRYLEVLREINRPELDYKQIEAVIKREPSLAHKLMRYINSVAFSFRVRIVSIRHALMLLGEDAVRKWASVVALAGLAEDQPSELVVNSLVRARFFEQVADALAMEERSQELFLMGLLSMLDAIIGRPLPEILADLPIAEDVKLALVGHRNRLRELFTCLTAYERGDWAAFATYATKLKLDTAMLARSYLDAVVWGTESVSGAEASSD